MDVLNLVASTLERGIDAHALELHAEVEGVVQRGEGGAIVKGYEVVLVDDVVAIDILILDVAHLDLSEFLTGAFGDFLIAFEEAEGYKVLADKFALTQEEIATRVGKARASVANAVRLLDLPDEVKQFMVLEDEEGRKLSVGHAKLLLGVEGDKARITLARECVSERLTVRALEKRIAKRAAEPVKKTVVSDVSSDYLRDLLDALHTRLGTSVRLTPSCTYANGRHGKGRIEIDYFDNDDLSRLLDLIGVDMNDL